MTETEFDCLIVGGGPTGAALALALSNLSSSFRTALLDAVIAPTDTAPTFDERVLAISEGSRCLLDQLGMWPALAAEACPIRHIHVSDRGQFGRAILNAAELGVAALGQVVPLRVIGQMLHRELAGRANIMRLTGKVTELSPLQDGIALQMAGESGQQRLQARLVLAADGGPSSLRALAGLPVEIDDYQQTALIATVRAEREHQNWAYERFTPTGPLALLPMTQNRLSLVWTQTPVDADRLLGVSESDFLRELQQAFGWRLGRLQTAGVREAFALKRVHSPVRRQGRLLLMGNAATTLHPIAGQGFNLALRDAMAFAEHLRSSLTAGADVALPATLDHFVANRQKDAGHVAWVTDSLVRLFSNEFPVLTPLRGAALSMLDLLPQLKRQVGKQAMGLVGS